jgi:GTP cyclohydrolase IB
VIEKNPPRRELPDIAIHAFPPVSGALDQVGMHDIETLVQVSIPGKSPFVIPARAEAYVSLQSVESKGIHMSRLFAAVTEILEAQVLTPSVVRNLLETFLSSHKDISHASYFSLHFELPIRRKALLSGNEGLRFYPCYVKGHLRDGKQVIQMGASITYSSTCPCSAALARHLVQQKFTHTFGHQKTINVDEVVAWLGTEEGMCATPHSQRSRADVYLTLGPDESFFDFLHLINLVEGALKTPVQAAVKREDEQEFTRLNGQNLMFCEDAARRIKGALDKEPRFVDYYIRAAHFESLHPHDAVATATKGIPDGFSV